MNKVIMDAIERTLKDWGIDWILAERGTDFKDVMSELELALKKVID